MSCWPSCWNSHLCGAQRLQAGSMLPLQPPLTQHIHSNGLNDLLLCSCSHFCLPPPPTPHPHWVTLHTVPQCQVSSTTADMAKHTPFPHARTLPEGEANRSSSRVAPSRLPTSAWIRVLPLGLQHGHGSLSLLRAACTASEGNQTIALRRQRLPCQGRSLNQCDDEVLGHSEGGPGVTRNLDLKSCRQKEEKKNRSLCMKKYRSLPPVHVLLSCSQQQREGEV